MPCGLITAAPVADMEQRRAVVRQLAAEFGARHVPYHGAFVTAQRLTPPEQISPPDPHEPGEVSGGGQQLRALPSEPRPRD